jgi:hypothetical protein
MCLESSLVPLGLNLTLAILWSANQSHSKTRQTRWLHVHHRYSDVEGEKVYPLSDTNLADNEVVSRSMTASRGCATVSRWSCLHSFVTLSVSPRTNCASILKLTCYIHLGLFPDMQDIQRTH